MSVISGEQVKQILDLYAVNQSILRTADEMGLSTVKVRKVLITEGRWQSDTSVQIGMLLTHGLTTEEIAERLHISVKNVQAYMPYEKGLYGGEKSSVDAVRAERYRSRMKKAASMQVVRKREVSNAETGEGMMQKVDKTVKEQESCGRKVLKLHLELDIHRLNEDEITVLKKYGMMQKAMTREILVPADITLHALHYVIQRCFGWQNSHLHDFELPEEVFQELTQNRFFTWSRLAGVYFRFPSEDYEDIYWDDDYKEGQSFRSWLRRKYTGPYRYKGIREYYLPNQIEVQDMFDRWRQIEIRDYDFKAKKSVKPYKVSLKDATVEQVENSFADMLCRELLERLLLAQILCMKSEGTKNVDEIRNDMLENMSGLDVQEAAASYQNTIFRSRKSEQTFLEQYDSPVQPVTEQLNYRYDYGDGWRVFITCEEEYEYADTGEWRSKTGKALDVSHEELEEVMTSYRPVCVHKDGIELLDDVGGIFGFYDMLRTIYQVDMENEQEREERDRMLSWAEMMGWTGRRIQAKRTL